MGKVLKPTSILEKNSDLRVGLILLDIFDNCPCLRRNLDAIWPKSKEKRLFYLIRTIRICADGAANRLRELSAPDVPADESSWSAKFDSRCRFSTGTKYIPTYICGDLDSLTGENLAYFSKKGTQIRKNTDVNATDFTKCIHLLEDLIVNHDNPVDCIVVLGGLCGTGRFDHVLACVQTLFLARFSPVYLLHNESLICLIPAGKTTIRLQRLSVPGKCGLVPIGAPANRVTTTGLKWNLYEQRMAYGEIVSTSNEIVDDEIKIATDSPLLWTMEVRTDKDESESAGRCVLVAACVFGALTGFIICSIIQQKS